MSIKFIIADGLDVNFYSKKEAAEVYMEAIDVKNGVFVGYDATGRLLKIEPRGQAAEITLAETESSHAEELRVLLLRFLKAVGQEPKKIDLETLLGMCACFVEDEEEGV